MSFSKELQRNTFQANVVLVIDDSIIISQYQPDNWDLTDPRLLGIINNFSISPIEVDFQSVRTTIASINFTLLDKDLVISKLIAQDKFAWLNKKVDSYIGFVTGNYPSSSYKKLSTTYIRSISKKENSYDIKAEEPQSLLKKRIYTTLTDITTALLSTDDHVHVTSTSSFPSSGILKAGNEFIQYSGKTSTSFTGLTRARLGSDAADASVGDLVFLVTYINNHSIDLLLDIIINQCGVSSDLVNSTQFTNIKTTYFNSDCNFSFYMYDIENALTWLEQNLLLPNNCRLITDKDGKISLKILDVAISGTNSDIFSEDFQIGYPSYSIDSNDLVNKIIIKSDYEYGTNKYLKTQIFTDAESISKFGEKELELEFKGLYSSADVANLIASNRASRLLSRLAYPRGVVETTTFFSKLENEIGDQVWFKSRFLPQPGSGDEFNNLLEIVSRAPMSLTNNAQIKWKLTFTSYSFTRIPWIGPSPNILNVISQKKFTIPSDQSDYFRYGYKIRIWDNVNNVYFSDPVNTIVNVNGNEITCENDFSTTLTTDIKVVFPDYDDLTAEQKVEFSSICADTNIFPDGSDAYQIII